MGKSDDEVVDITELSDDHESEPSIVNTNTTVTSIQNSQAKPSHNPNRNGGTFGGMKFTAAKNVNKSLPSSTLSSTRFNPKPTSKMKPPSFAPTHPQKVIIAKKKTEVIVTAPLKPLAPPKKTKVPVKVIHKPPIATPAVPFKPHAKPPSKPGGAIKLNPIAPPLHVIKNVPPKSGTGDKKEGIKSHVIQAWKKEADLPKSSKEKKKDVTDVKEMVEENGREKKEENGRGQKEEKLKKFGVLSRTGAETDEKMKFKGYVHMPKPMPMTREMKMEEMDDAIIFVEETKRKIIRFNCPSLEFKDYIGFDADDSTEPEDLTQRVPSKKYIDADCNVWEDSWNQFAITKATEKERDEKEEEAEMLKGKNKRERERLLAARKRSQRAFVPGLDRIIETPQQAKRRRGKPDFKKFLDEVPEYSWQQICPFYQIRRIDGIVKASDNQREHQRVISARVNPNPNIPYVVSAGVNKVIYVHNYLTEEQRNQHRIHFTYTTDVDWSHCGHYIIASGTDKMVAIMEAEACFKSIHDRFYSESIPVAARFTQDRNLAVVAMESGGMDIFDLRENPSQAIRRIVGMPNITCVDTNPLSWNKLAIGFQNGNVTEYDFYDDHRKSNHTSYFQYFLPGRKTPIFTMLPYDEYDDLYTSSEVKCLRYCSSRESECRDDLIVTMSDRNEERGDSAYKFSPGRETQPVIAYIPEKGINLSCATFSYNRNVKLERDGLCETYVVAGTEEGTIVAFNADNGEIPLGGTDVVDDPSLEGNNEMRYEGMDREGGYTSYCPVRKYFPHENACFDPLPATRITAIDSIPDPYLGSFIVGGWGENPTLNVYRFNDYSQFDQKWHL